ncbi:MAG: hypothetical protein Q8P80_05705 [Candidatus Levybacteria bacterium]|nr:hypothetical protein [Candidatus Levybacteria bacterium]
MQNKFIFKGWKADIKKGRASFFYELQNEGQTIKFEEKISFSPVQKEIPSEVLKPIFDSLLLILGVSYWKLYCPKIELGSVLLNREQAEFWNKVYTKGLGEFFYKNKIDFRGLVHFPYEEKSSIHSDNTYHHSDRSLVFLGGGKDSIVTAEILKKQGKDFDLFVLNNTSIHDVVVKTLDKKPIIIKREIDPKLFELNNQKGVFNGHVPISAVFAFMGILAATLYDYKYIIVSNERSANEGNVEYRGEIINHQWSKSFEFEKMFNGYLKKFITKDIHYFSLLRPFSELKITQLFSAYKKYFNQFTSCNRNFSINPKNMEGKWCGSCPKCAFVFTALSAFLTKEEVLKIFGKNLFDEEKLLGVFKELLGMEKFKPFECVGTKEETKYAMYLVSKKGEFSNDPAIKMFEKEVLAGIEAEKLEKEVFTTESINLIPEEFKVEA